MHSRGLLTHNQAKTRSIFKWGASKPESAAHISLLYNLVVYKSVKERLAFTFSGLFFSSANLFRAPTDESNGVSAPADGSLWGWRKNAIVDSQWSRDPNAFFVYAALLRRQRVPAIILPRRTRFQWLLHEWMGTKSGGETNSYVLEARDPPPPPISWSWCFCGASGEEIFLYCTSSWWLNRVTH